VSLEPVIELLAVLVFFLPATPLLLFSFFAAITHANTSN
jgi:hypothetical protein